ncbi:MAG TPA: 7TM diverse intracellular signaling domain-containing protein [Chryseosolibacter sp.]
MARFKFVVLSLIALLALASCQKKSQQEKAVYFLFEDSTATITAQHAWENFKQQKFQRQQKQSFNPGFTTSIFWLVVDAGALKNNSTLLEIGQAQINEILFHEIIDDTPVLRFTTGDHMPFSARPLSSLNFTFPLTDSVRHYLLKIDKKNEALQLTFLTKPADTYFTELGESSLIIGIMTGAIVLMVIFGVFLFLITKEYVYLFYVLYISAGWLYVLANQGYVYKYLWPNDPWFAARTRPVAALLTISFSLHFIKYYAGEAPFRWLSKTLECLAYIAYFLAALFLIPTLETKASTLGYYVQAALPVLAAIYILSLLATLVHKILNKNRMAMFFLLSVTPIVLFSTLQIFYYAGGLDFSGSYLQTYGQATGYVAEAIILTFGLAYRFNTYKQDKEQLLINLNKQQVRYAKAIITTQENERRQLADQLHDVAGSLLSAARLNLSAVREKNYLTNEDAKRKLESAEHAVSDISNILRNMSHAISPVMLDKVGFRQSIDKIVSIFNASGKIRFELEMLGFENEDKSMYEKYSVLYGILYELMNNIVKHARASHALIQVIEHDDSVVLIVEDNGIGLAEKDPGSTATHGLAAIHSKVHYLNGHVMMEDAQPQGLIVTIEIPKVNHDENNIG